MTSRALGRLLFLFCAFTAWAVIVGGLQIPADAAPTKAGVTPSAAGQANVTERPDPLSAMTAARSSGHKVEDLSRRSETTQVFANPDGSWSADEADGPVRTQDAQGHWVDIDTSLVAVDGGYAPANAIGGLIVSDGGDKTFAQMTVDGHRLQWKWPTSLPAPVVSGDTATYPGAVDGGDLVVTATPTGFQHDIVLDHAPSKPATFRIPVVTDGPAMGKGAHGDLSITTHGGHELVRAAQPTMHDASRNEVGDPEHVAVVGTRVVGTGTGSALSLEPAQSFLTDPSTVYPVTIDPSYTSKPQKDTWLENPNYTTGQGGSDELRVGSYNGGTNRARAFIQFATNSDWVNQKITSAKLTLRNYYSSTCSGTAVRVARLTGSWTTTGITWSNQPGVNGTNSVDNATAKGYNSSCPGGDVSWTVTGIVQGWASGSYANDGFRVAAANETSSLSWRRYRSANYSTSSVRPRLYVSWNSYPSASSLSVGPGNAGYARSTGPTVSAKVSDPDGGSVTANFSVLSGSTTVWTGSKSVTSGSTASVTLPSGKLVDGTSYTLKVSASDGSLSSKTTPTLAFKDDTSAPATTIGCSAYPSSGTWLDSAPGSNTCTLTAPTDTASWQVTEDSGTAFTVKASSGTGSVSWNPTSGAHTLKATATDLAGNTGATASFGFGVGSAGMTSPADDASSAAGFPVTMTGPANATGAKLQWRIQGSTDAWNNATQTTVDGSPWTGSAPTTDGVSSPGALVWTPAGESLASAPGGKLTAPALVEIRGCFTYASGPDSCTPVTPLQLDDGFGPGYAVAPLGPVQVALTTGNISYASADAIAGGAGFGRSWTTSAVAGYGATSPFGIGWSSDALTSGESESTVLDRHTDSDKSFVIAFSTGGDETFSWSSTDPDTLVETYLPTDSNDDTTELVYTPATQTANATLVLTQDRDTSAPTTTSWHYDGTSTSWALDGSTDPATVNSADVSAGRVTWVSQVPVGSSSSCTATTQGPGCRGLALTYTGDQVTAITLKAYGAPDEVVASYTYDNVNKTLTKVCGADPGTGSGPLCTSYTYNLSAGAPAQLASVTPPGQDTWNLDYDSAGRVVDATRSEPGNAGTSRWVIDYGQPLSDQALPDMSASATAQWGQTSPPTKVYALYAPQADGTTPTGDPTKAELDYAGVDGTLTNTADHGPGGWMVQTTWRNPAGNTTQVLDGTGYLRVMAAAPADRPGVAQDASSYTEYGSGTHADRVADEFGPAHSATLEDGTTGEFRAHTHYVYADQDASLGGPNPDSTSADDLVVETDTSAADPSKVGADHDVKVVRYDYNPIVTGDGNGWTLGMPTRVKTQVDANSWSVTTTRYDADGHVIETRQPGGATDSAGAGSDAHSTKYEYYTATNADADCRNGVWAGSPCKTVPVAADTELPTVWNKAYDDAGRLTDVVETSGNTTRETATSYDLLGRTVHVAKSVTNGAAADDNATLVTDISYDAQGNPTQVTDGSAAINQTFDTWGRPTAYTDALGTHSTTTYNGAGRVATVDDSAGTYTYTYDGYGSLASVDTGGAGTFTYSWTSDGNIDKITLPNGMVQDRTYDEVGTLTGLDYSQGGTAVIAFDATTDVNGRTLSQDSSESHQDFGYDGLGRLTQVHDTRASGCVTRAYGFDASSNRTSLTSYAPDATTGDCQTTTASTSRATGYNAAGQSTGAGYSYDNLGRARSIAAADTQAGVQAAADGVTGVSDVTAGYHVDDMVASLTQTLPDDTGALHTTTTSYGIDAAERVDMVTTATDGAETQRLRYRYAGESDSPAVIDTSTDGGTSWSSTRYVAVPGMGTAASVSGGTAELMLGDLHGNVVATCGTAPGTSLLDSYAESDEYGNPLDQTGADQRYNWLGTYQRSTDAPAGFTLMGARVYNAQTGLFAQNDPVLGGNLTRYGYPEDPINQMDLSGQMWSWVFNAGMWAVGHVLSMACDATAVFFMVCNVAVGALVGVITYYGYHRYVSHTSTTSTGARYAAISGALSGLGGGLFSRTLGRRIYSFWVGNGRRMISTLQHKLWAMHWNVLASLAWDGYYWASMALARLAGR